MKPLQFKTPLFRAFIWMTLISVAVIINSCRKDNFNNSPTNNIAIKDSQLDIGQLQKAYNKGISGNTIKTNGTGSKTLEDMVGTLDVDWSSYTIQDYADSTRIAEFEMPNDASIFALSNTSDTVRYLGRTKVVFVLHKNTIKNSFFMKVIEDLNAPGSRTVLNELHYLQIPSTFSGQVFYFSLGRNLLNGYKWAKGSIVTSLSPLPGQQQTQNTSPGPKTNSMVVETCFMNPVYDIVIHTEYLPGIPYAYVTYKLVGYVQECSYSTVPGGSSGGTGAGDGGGGVSTGSGGGGSSAPPQQCPTVIVAYAKGKRLNYISPNCPIVTPQPPPSPTPPSTSIFKSYEDRIDTKKLTTCFQGIVNATKLGTTGTLTTVMASFVGNSSSALYTWKIANGTLAGDGTAQTNWSASDKTVSTVIDESKFANATDLVKIRTFFHEAIHGYLIAYFKNDPIHLNEDYPSMLNDYMVAEAAGNSSPIDQAHHDQFVRSFIEDMATSIKVYGDSKKYGLNIDFYKDLCWGGLTTTHAFLALSTTEQKRILNFLSAQQNGYDLSGTPSYTQKGKIKGCGS